MGEEKNVKLQFWSQGYISKGTLARAVSTTTSHTRDTGYSSSCTPGLCTGLVSWNKQSVFENAWAQSPTLNLFKLWWHIFANMPVQDRLTCQFTDCIWLATVLAHVGVHKIHHIRANWSFEHSRHDDILAWRFSFLGINRDQGSGTGLGTKTRTGKELLNIVEFDKVMHTVYDAVAF